MKFDFTGQTALITGGTRGIGRAISEAFLKAGAKVVATYRGNDMEAENFKNANADYADFLDIHKFDVTDYEAVENFYKEVEKKHDNFQILVVSSGIRADSIVGMMKAEDWNRVINTNLTGTFNLSKLAVQSMMRQRYGRIITLTSPIGKFGFAGQANYAASKAGQVAFTRSLSKEVASRKITVNCVSPGFIDTDFISDLPDEQKKAYKDQIPLKRFGTPEDVTYPVLFLAAKQSAYITGSVLEVTGGL
ncbi:MAG: 3-oxoacyl-ACP reductase FabG [Nitrospinaceae bacterium]|nr:3-oxoacyl-ACP reductase FabG [Nitrospina sp.]MBT5377064.1 3-oxoacyl-ACP reductase FabG [Nitrospinaceae bacterium]MBT5867774.1 3-oxoacyl-ACP reductase FabG [Nitrospinaceae bacterium]MBT6346402.1 3-oxoacyl-ACP reductase FabG [Nitrospina sp.]